LKDIYRGVKIHVSMGKPDWDAAWLRLTDEQRREIGAEIIITSLTTFSAPSTVAEGRQVLIDAMKRRGIEP
jgi:hypothetical protein